MIGTSILIIVSVSLLFSVQGFHFHRTNKARSSHLQLFAKLPTTRIFPNKEVVGESLCKDIVEFAKDEIQKKGAFYLAVPGGSAVKLLKYLTPYKDSVDWSKVTLFYVNHKCVPDDDESATHFKARNIFLDHIGRIKAYVPDATQSNPADIAISYASTLKSTLPTANGLPLFDLVVLGMGKDGHIGSLYPGRQEVDETAALVLSVDKKTPNSVTITLPVFNNAKNIRVVVVGDDKAEAVSTAINKKKSRQDFPVCGIRNEPNIEWLLDTGSASQINN